MTASHASPPASSGSKRQGWRPVPRSWLLTVVRLGRWRAEQSRQLRGGPFPVIGRSWGRTPTGPEGDPEAKAVRRQGRSRAVQ